MSEPDAFGRYRVKDNQTGIEHSVRVVFPDLQTILDKPASQFDGSPIPQSNPLHLPVAARQAEEASNS